MYLIGVDVGGTFTDIVFADTESSRTLIHKTPTTKDDPSRGVVAGISALCARFDLPRQAIDHVLHGTTIGTNAVLERTGSRVGLITTAGHCDALAIMRRSDVGPMGVAALVLVLLVQVTATIDVTTDTITWDFLSVDPSTGAYDDASMPDAAEPERMRATSMPL